MPNPQRLAASPSSRATSEGLSFELAASLKDLSSSRPPTSASAKKGFSSVAPSEAPRGGGAETKLYQVPRELIEIARANAKSRKSTAAVGTLTPIAPRPDAELEANAKAYAAQISETPAAPSDIRLIVDAMPASEKAAASSGTRLAMASEPAVADPSSGSALLDASDAESRAVAERLSDGPVIEAEPAADIDEHDEALYAAPLASIERAFSAAPLVASGRVWLYASVLVALGYCAQLALAW